MHTPEYIAAVQQCAPNPKYGLGTTDNPIFPGMHEVSGLVAMASVEAARRVWHGEAKRASNISGGLHHAMPDRTSGFCVYNDIGVAIRWLLENGCERVGYVDVDVHHGDGVQAIFYDDPRVMTISLHETPAYLFPGTGFPHETGGPGAEGTSVNVALPPGTDDAGWLRAFHAVVPQALQRLPAQRAGHPARVRLAPPRSAGRPGAQPGRAARLVPGAGGPGRRVVRGALGLHRWRRLRRAHVVPLRLDPPARHRQRRSRCRRKRWCRRPGGPEMGEGAPLPMTDGADVDYVDFEDGFTPESRIDQAILATRRAVFPELGLDPAFLTGSGRLNDRAVKHIGRRVANKPVHLLYQQHRLPLLSLQYRVQEGKPARPGTETGVTTR